MEKAFAQVKAELSQPTVLALYDPKASTKLSADASSYRLASVLLQQTESSWKPVAYAYRVLSETEKRYAQIEKEALAITWACENISTYPLGRSFEVDTDHKPLVLLLNSKHFDNLPPRILGFQLKMAQYTYSVFHVSGKLLYTADAVSRAPLTHALGELENEVDAYV